MAVEIVNTTPDKGDNLESAVKPVEQKQEPVVAQPKQEDDVPEKYRGKSAADIIRMHQEAEKVIGKQGAELGQLRSTYDQVIQATLQKPKQATAEVKPETQGDDFDEVEFFANPKQAVSKLLEKHPALQELRTAHIQEQHQKARQLFAQKHPDAQEILGSEDFRQWVQASKVRTQLLVQADRAFDVDAADELFSTWKQIHKREAAKQEVAEATQNQALKAGMVPTGSSSPMANTGGKKIYRRADIIKLMQEDPRRYEMLAEEITQAYTEGRVR